MKYLICFFAALFFLFNSCDTIIVDESNSYDYSMEQRMDCFCSQTGIWVKLFIKADTVSNAVRVSDNNQLSYDDFKYYKSIKGLFDTITETDTTVYNLVVTYNSEINYPSYIYLNPKPFVTDSITWIIADAELAYSTKSYVRLK